MPLAVVSAADGDTSTASSCLKGQTELPDVAIASTDSQTLCTAERASP